MDGGRVWGEIGKRLEGASGRGELLDLVAGVAAVFGVECPEVVVVGFPGWVDREDHVGFGLQRAKAEGPEAFGVRLGRRDILDEDEVGLASEVLGAADAIEGLGDARPDVGGVDAVGEGEAKAGSAMTGDVSFPCGGDAGDDALEWVSGRHGWGRWW